MSFFSKPGIRWISFSYAVSFGWEVVRPFLGVVLRGSGLFD